MHLVPPSARATSRRPDDATTWLRPSLGEPARTTLARLAVVEFVAIGAVLLLGFSQPQAWAVLAVAMMWTLVPGARIRTLLVAVAATWLLGTGFVTDRQGALTFTADDLGNAALLALTAGLVALVNARARAALALGHPQAAGPSRGREGSCGRDESEWEDGA